MAATTTVEALLNSLREKWHSGSAVKRLIWINVAVFLLLRLTAIVFLIFGIDTDEHSLVSLVGMPGQVGMLIRRPWTVLTYMLSQYDVMHLVFNMIWLYWFGETFLMVSTQRQTVALYICGGIAGAMLYILAYNASSILASQSGVLIGSSASVIAIVAATAVILPDHRFNLLFLGEVSLKWIALVTIGIDLIGMGGGNAGGHIAHLGGAVIGVVYGLYNRKGIDITAPFCRCFDRVAGWFHLKVKAKKVPDTRPQVSADDRELLDLLLDKIKRSGYSSLSRKERALLFDLSRRING